MSGFFQTSTPCSFAFKLKLQPTNQAIVERKYLFVRLRLNTKQNCIHSLLGTDAGKVNRGKWMHLKPRTNTEFHLEPPVQVLGISRLQPPDIQRLSRAEDLWHLWQRISLHRDLHLWMLWGFFCLKKEYCCCNFFCGDIFSVRDVIQKWSSLWCFASCQKLSSRNSVVASKI